MRHREELLVDIERQCEVAASFEVKDLLDQIAKLQGLQLVYDLKLVQRIDELLHLGVCPSKVVTCLIQLQEARPFGGGVRVVELYLHWQGMTRGVRIVLIVLQ